MLGRGARGRWASLGIVMVSLCGGAAGALAAPSDTPTAGKPPAPAAYSEPAPVRIYRFHVYSTMKLRWKKTVMIDALVSTSSKGVTEGDHALLERQLEKVGGESGEWAPIAKVLVKKLLPKGRLQMEIESEEAEAKVKRNGKLPFAPGQKVRLQVDRVMSGGS